MKFNVNEHVWVKLTPEGRQYHREADARFWADRAPRGYQYRPPVEDADGWSKWQLWHLMHDFGPGIRMGNRPLFETEISLVDPAKAPPAA